MRAEIKIKQRYRSEMVWIIAFVTAAFIYGADQAHSANPNCNSWETIWSGNTGTVQICFWYGSFIYEGGGVAVHYAFKNNSQNKIEIDGGIPYDNGRNETFLTTLKPGQELFDPGNYYIGHRPSGPVNVTSVKVDDKVVLRSTGGAGQKPICPGYSKPIPQNARVCRANETAAAIDFYAPGKACSWCY